MDDQHFVNRNTSEKSRAADSQRFADLGDKGRAARDEARSALEDTASSARDAVKASLDRQIEAGARLIGHFASSVRIAADDLDGASPVLGKLVRGFAKSIDDFKEDLQGQTAEQLIRSASDFTRRQPALVFGIAALAGFVGLRTFKNAKVSSVKPERRFDYAPYSGNTFFGNSPPAGGRVTSQNAINDETPDGLNALEESLRRAAEDTPVSQGNYDDVPVFDRGDMPPRI